MKCRRIILNLMMRLFILAMSRKYFLMLFLFLAFLVAPLASSAFSGGYGTGFNNNWQYYQPSFNQLYGPEVSSYWPIYDQLRDGQCNATSDFYVMIPPGGCSPSVVRSDLLAEQNVPVFCQLEAIQVNPLIEVSSIKSISFKGEYPEGVAGISFHPARAATRSYRTLLGSPVVNNIGYVVIILKREAAEKNVEDMVSGKLTATIRYDAEEAYGVGRATYFLPILNENEWNARYAEGSFWKGRGYLRLSDVDSNSATIDIYSSKDYVFNTLTLSEGETSGLMYFPNYYCRAGFSVRLDSLVAPEDSALLNIDGEETWVRAGSRILNNQCSVRSLDIRGNGTGTVKISCPGSSFDLNVGEKEGDVCLSKINDEVRGTFNEGTSTVKELVNNYPSEKKGEFEDTYGEESLIHQIDLAGSVGDFETEKELMRLFLKKYEGRPSAGEISKRLNGLDSYDYCNAYRNVLVTDKYHSIGVREFKKINKEDKKVSLRVGNVDFDRSEGENITDSKIKGRFEINRVLPGEVRISYISDGTQDNTFRSSSITLREGEYGTLGGLELYIRRIELDTFAQVSLIPEVPLTTTEADFTFNIGVEKRNIELSPERTKEMIKNVEDNIGKWEDITGTLGDTITALKGACFATSSVLMIKNFASGFGGVGLARQKVMARYKEKCAVEYPDKTPTECYNNLSKQIGNDVDCMASALDSVNSKLKGAQEGNVENGGLLKEGSLINQDKYLKDLRTSLEAESWRGEVNGVELDSSNLETTTQIRSVMLVEELRKGGKECSLAFESALSERNRILESVSYSKKSKDEREAAALEISKLTGGSVLPDVVSDTPENIRQYRWGGQYARSFPKIPSEIDDESRVQYYTRGGKGYLLVLDGSPFSSSLDVSKAYRSSEGGFVLETNTSLFDDISFVKSGASGECANKWPEGTAEVRYYESGTSKGLPALVPFDLREGWYAVVPNSAGTLLEGSPAGYQDSGVVEYFKICNIGKNGVMQSGTGDDLCQPFSIHSAGEVKDFIPCSELSSEEVRRLYQRATEAIRQASRQYESNNIMILYQQVKRGSPYGSTGEVECQDFMSPDECRLMFNVCDPVICPSSRCNLGGKLPVADVIQTGVVGGMLMCLPNYKEGIVVPLCLSGIHAGLDSYVSILKSERDCLKASLETGQHIGICDEITSVYKCEFFWRQASPVMRLFFERTIEKFTGASRTRGGGEYLLVQSAFDNLDKSLSYFKNEYAQNAFRAFQFRNIEEAGGEFCKAFVGTSFPASADAIDSLLEPESPPQFFAYFSENTFSDATIPATSHYKVYYHIYAGNDLGIQYRVYLKNPPASGYYSANPILNVKTGYIAKGTSADESVDFTAPEGYKELCVVYGSQKECGFKQVTSDVGIKLVTENYVKEQVEKADITSEKECISGTPSLVPSASLNLQDLATEAINPDITKRGIIRVCASSSPGASELDGTSRWKEVGYCGETNLKCWLDTESVSDNLNTLSAVGEGLDIKDLDENKNLIEKEIETEEEVKAILSWAGEEIDDIQVKGFSEDERIERVVSKLSEISGSDEHSTGFGTNQDKAKALYLRAALYYGIVKNNIGEAIPKAPKVSRPVDEEGDNQVRETKLGDLDKGNLLIKDGREYTIEKIVEEGGYLTIYLKGFIELPPDNPVITGSSEDILEGYQLFVGRGNDLGVESVEVRLGDLNKGDKLKDEATNSLWEVIQKNPPRSDGKIVIFLKSLEGSDPVQITGNPRDKLKDFQRVE